MPTDEQRAQYLSAVAELEAAELEIKPQIDALMAQIADLEAPVVASLRAAVTAITDEIGEPVTRCIFCEKLIFDGDDYVAGEEDMCVPCNKEAWDSMSEEDKAARWAELEEEDRQTDGGDR